MNGMQQNNGNGKGNGEPPIRGPEVVRVVVATLVILLLGFLLVALVGAWELSQETGGAPDAKRVEEWAEQGISGLPLSLKILAVIVQASLIVPAIVFLRRKGLSIPRHLRLRPVPARFYLYSLVIGLGVAVLGDELSRLVDMVAPVPEDMISGLERMMKLRTWGDVLTLGLAVVVVAPVVEEMLFRGFFQRYFESARGVTSGVLTASALFAAYHFNLYWLIPILIMATIMGAMAWRVESAHVSIVVHAVNNLLGLLAANFMLDSSEWYTMGEHVSPIILGISLILLVWGLNRFFRDADILGLGGHGPGGDSGKRINTTV